MPRRAQSLLLNFIGFILLNFIYLKQLHGQIRFSVVGTQSPPHDGGVVSPHCRRAGGMENIIGANFGKYSLLQLIHVALFVRWLQFFLRVPLLILATIC